MSTVLRGASHGQEESLRGPIKGYRALPKLRHALQRMIGKEVTAA